MSRVSWLFEDEYFPAKIRAEPCPNPHKVSLRIVWLSPLRMSYHFSISRGFYFSNWIFINFDGIHSFSSPVETKAKPLPQCNTCHGFHSEVNTSLIVFSIIQCLSAAVVPFSSAFRKFEVHKALCNLFWGYLLSLLFNIFSRVRFDLSITACPCVVYL